MSENLGYGYFVVCDNGRVRFEIDKLREFLRKNPPSKRVNIYLHSGLVGIKLEPEYTLVIKYIREDQVGARVTGQHDIQLIRPHEVYEKLKELEVIKDGRSQELSDL